MSGFWSTTTQSAVQYSPVWAWLRFIHWQ